MTKASSIFSKEIDPLTQAIYVFAGSLMFTLLFKIFEWTGMTSAQSYLPWTMSAAGLLFYGLFNSVMSLSAENINKYWARSIMCFGGLMIVGGLVSYLISGQTISEAMSFKWLYLVFTFGYLLFLSIVRAMKKVVQIAKKQDAKLRGE